MGYSPLDNKKVRPDLVTKQQPQIQSTLISVILASQPLKEVGYEILLSNIYIGYIYTSYIFLQLVFSL